MSMYATIELSKSGHQKLPPDLDPENQGLMYGKGLIAMSDELDALAAELGVRPISTFLDDSDMLDEEEREELGLPPAEAKWAPVEDGLNTVRVLLAALTAAGRSDEELWDLRVSERILSAAKSGEKFRYDIL